MLLIRFEVLVCYSYFGCGFIYLCSERIGLMVFKGFFSFKILFFLFKIYKMNGEEEGMII